MALQLRYVSHSEIGLIRKNNQDSGYASAHLLVVADGMGGAAAGDLASAVAIDTLRRIEGPAEGDEMLEVLSGAIYRANDRIADLVEADSNLEGMGTTVTGAMFDGAELGLVHIGDSRAYLLREDTLTRLTHDHSWVQSLVDEGKITEAEASYHPHRSLLLKVLNGQAANDPDLSRVAVQSGDRLMFCSDGVCGLIDDAGIQDALKLPDLSEALGQLVAVSLAEGGIDNITVIVADVVESGGVAEPVVLGAAAEGAIPSPETKRRSVLTEDSEDENPADARRPDGDDNSDEDTAITRRVTPEPAPDEERYTPQAPIRRRTARPLIGVIVLALILAGLGAAFAWIRTQYYVGASGPDVAIFRGLADNEPGIRKSTLYEVQPLKIDQLPAYYRDKVRSNIEVDSLDSARQTVVQLTEIAKRCSGPGTKPGSQPSDGGTTGPTNKTSAPVTPLPTATPQNPTNPTEPNC